MRINKEFLTASVRTLRDAGIDDHAIEPGSKHPRLVFHHQGRRLEYILPGSSSDHRALRNLVGDLRRMTGQQGRPAPAAVAPPADPSPGAAAVAEARGRVAANPPRMATDRDRRLAALLDCVFAGAPAIGRRAGGEGVSLERLERLVALGLAEGDGLGRYRRVV